MRRNNIIVLVNCQPIAQLHQQYPSIVMQPQTGEVPLGLLYLAGELEHSGFDVVIKDNTITSIPNDELADEIAALSPLLVGFSLLAFNVRNVRDVARLFKHQCPDIPLVLGGPHATILPMEFAMLDFVDVVITHQGELSLKNIAIQVKNGEFKPTVNPAQKVIRGVPPESLDDLQLPARHLIDLNKYKRLSYVMDITPTDYVCSSRGCPFKCAFCSSKTFWEQRYFKRTPRFVVDEIEKLIEDYGSQGIYFREDNFTVSRKHVQDVCKEIIARNLKIKWECESRVDTLKKEDLELMKEAGCSGIWCGVESGSQKILDAIMKGYNIEQVRRFFNWCKEIDLPVAACFMIGFPHETAQDIISTYELSLSLSAKWVQFATYVGFPKSEVYEEILRSSLWEARWEDVFISRNENFTTSQLYALEFSMNRDAAIFLSHLSSSTSERPHTFYGAWKKLLWYLNHPSQVIQKVKTLSHGHEKPSPSFYELLSKFSKELHRSNP